MFTQGQVVQLKSGGPAMTVQERFTASNSVRCVFFDGQGEVDELHVPEACLQEYKEPAKRTRTKK